MTTKRNDLAIYDGAAAQWWSDEIRWLRILRNMVPGRLQWFDRHVEWRGREVLDLGCGGGFMAEALAERGARVTGLDPATRAIAAAREHAAARGLEIRYHVGSGEKMDYPDASFDAVVCVDVLEHVRDLDRVLANVARVLRPGGRLFFDTINRNALSRFAAITMAERVLRILPRGTHDPDLFITPAELDAALSRAGLALRDRTGLGPRGIDRKGDPTFGPVPLTAIVWMGYAERPG